MPAAAVPQQGIGNCKGIRHSLKNQAQPTFMALSHCCGQYSGLWGAVITAVVGLIGRIRTHGRHFECCLCCPALL